MDFGQKSDLRDIDWSLPQDDPCNQDILRGENDLEVLVGCPIWANAKWLGTLYPPGTPRQKFLDVYSENFPAIEYNGSFYHLPSLDQVDDWRKKTPQRFLFCPKIPRRISHEAGARVEFSEEALKVFQALGDRLGLPFVQFPPTFTVQKGQWLKDIAEVFCPKFPLAIELRHPSWLQEGSLHSRVRSYFIEKQLFPVILDTPGRRDLLHSTLTGSQAMVRFLASGQTEVDNHRLEVWCERLRVWGESGLRRLYFFVHAPDDQHAPQLADRLIRIYNQSSEKKLIPPRFHHQMKLLID